MDTRDAIRAAREKGMDLVEVAPNADPPVCKIIDYGKFQYLAKKKANEAKKKQVIITVKEVKFRPGTDEHDYSYRMKHAREWLTEGDKVKATIWFRGREMTHRELGARILEKLEKDLADISEVEMRPRMEGNQMFTIFGPKRHKGAPSPRLPARVGAAVEQGLRPRLLHQRRPQSQPRRLRRQLRRRCLCHLLHRQRLLNRQRLLHRQRQPLRTKISRVDLD